MENCSFLGYSRKFVFGRSLPNTLSLEDKICVFLFASISNIKTTKESNRFVKKDGIPTPHLHPSMDKENIPPDRGLLNKKQSVQMNTFIDRRVSAEEFLKSLEEKW